MRLFLVLGAFLYGSLAYAQQGGPGGLHPCVPLKSPPTNDLLIIFGNPLKQQTEKPAAFEWSATESPTGERTLEAADLCHDAAEAIPDKAQASEEIGEGGGGQGSQVNQQQSKPPAGNSNPAKPDTPAGEPAQKNIPTSEQQPKRILSIMPNYKAVSAGAIPPPPTAKESLWIATENTFDYSSFIFVGITSLIAKGTDAHPQLGKDFPGYASYYWHGFVDKADGNYLVLFALPTLLHEDERYYAMGHAGGVWKRLGYSATRVLITPNYQGHNTFNFSEILGRGAAQAISTQYYPAQDNTASAVAARFGYAVLRDAATNMFREFWPDIAVHVLHRHP